MTESKGKYNCRSLRCASQKQERDASVEMTGLGLVRRERRLGQRAPAGLSAAHHRNRSVILRWSDRGGGGARVGMERVCRNGEGMFLMRYPGWEIWGGGGGARYSCVNGDSSAALLRARRR